MAKEFELNFQRLYEIDVTPESTATYARIAAGITSSTTPPVPCCRGMRNWPMLMRIGHDRPPARKAQACPHLGVAIQPRYRLHVFPESPQSRGSDMF